MDIRDKAKELIGESSVGYANEPTDIIARRVIENSLNDLVVLIANKILDLEASGVVLTSSDLLTALNSYFNMMVSEKLLISILNEKTYLKIGVKF